LPPVPPSHATHSGDRSATRDAQVEGAAHRWYALGLLFLVYVFNFIDRSILNILAPAIKKDLGLSDTQIGFLGGIAFAVFYTFVGIPIARLADRAVRRDILAACLAIWSAMTAACGFAQSFVHLLLARIGVAVGEAGGSPPSHSMISDLFPARSRATALAVYSLGIPVGTMLGNLAGGHINDLLDWRVAFIVVGLPGVLLAVVVRFTLREPSRGHAEGAAAAAVDAQPPPVMVAFRALWSRRSFRYLSLGAAFHAFVGYGAGGWLPSLFDRVHGLSSSEIGEALFWLGFAGIAGTFSGGYLADRLAVRDQRWYVWLPALATLASVPFTVFTYVWHEPVLAFWVYAIPSLLGAYYLGPTFSLTQGLVGLRMRALAAALVLFVLNLIGMGLGPQFVGVLSDLLQAFAGLDDGASLRASLIVALVFNVLSTVFYLMAAVTLRDDLRRSHEIS
jgi:predicted MFS family arabinose efflux permease